MNFPRISVRTFAGLSLAGSIIIIITTSIWFSQADPERFGITLIAGMLMLVSANLVYVLLSHRLRPATVAGSVWITTILWLLFMMAVDSADSHNDPYSPNYDHHGSGFLWLGLPVFYVGSLIASISPPPPAPNCTPWKNPRFKHFGRPCAGLLSALPVCFGFSIQSQFWLFWVSFC